MADQMDVFSLTVQYGLPLVMFFGVLWLSLTGKIVWRGSHDEIVAALREVIETKEQRNAVCAEERDRLFDLALPAVRSLEQGAEALKGVRK